MKKKIPWGEFVFLAVLLGYAAYYFFSVRGYSYRAVLWPCCLMAAMVAAALAVGMEVIKKAPAAEETGAEKPELRQLLLKNAPILVIIAVFICYTLLLRSLGLHLCNFLLVFCLTLYLNKGRWKTALIAACAITLSFYLVFDLALGMRLPGFKLF